MHQRELDTFEFVTDIGPDLSLKRLNVPALRHRTCSQVCRVCFAYRVIYRWTGGHQTTYTQPSALWRIIWYKQDVTISCCTSGISRTWGVAHDALCRRPRNRGPSAD
jgi:hypothetical protein